MILQNLKISQYFPDFWKGSLPVAINTPAWCTARILNSLQTSLLVVQSYNKTLRASASALYILEHAQNPVQRLRIKWQVCVSAQDFGSCYGGGHILQTTFANGGSVTMKKILNGVV